MFRKSNLLADTVGSFSADKQFIRSDFTMAGKYVLVRVKYSKTIQCKEREYIVKLPVLNSPLCPVTALLHAFSTVPLAPEAPAFVSNSKGSPLTGPAFTNRLKELVSLCGEDPRLFASHSFRRGSAVWALSAGIPGEIIKQMGDWKSSVYLRYLDTIPHKVLDSYVDMFSSCLPKL